MKINNIFAILLIYAAIPIPNITVTASNNKIAGESLIPDCTVDVPDNLYNINVYISIVSNQRGVIANNTGSGDTTAIGIINASRSSDAGDYQCIVNITQSDIDYVFNGMESTQVILTCMLK